MPVAGPKEWTETIIAERVKLGRGQGLREAYYPWLLVQEFSSSSNQSRIPCSIFARTIHTFSYLERCMFLYHEWHGFWDYREQFPLDRDTVMAIARRLKLPYPVYRKSQVPFVMTLDALMTTLGPQGEHIFSAWDAKPTDKLRMRTVQAALRLHEEFCAELQIPYNLFTEQTHSPYLLQNIAWARGGLPIHGERLPCPDFFTKELERFYEWLGSRSHEHPVYTACMMYDQLRHFEPGTSLRLFKLLVWRRRLNVDMEAPSLAGSLLPRNVAQLTRDERNLNQRRA
jgi:hypothetical protein